MTDPLNSVHIFFTLDIIAPLDMVFNPPFKSPRCSESQHWSITHRNRKNDIDIYTVYFMIFWSWTHYCTHFTRNRIHIKMEVYISRTAHVQVRLYSYMRKSWWHDSAAGMLARGWLHPLESEIVWVHWWKGNQQAETTEQLAVQKRLRFTKPQTDPLQPFVILAGVFYLHGHSRCNPPTIDAFLIPFYASSILLVSLLKCAPAACRSPKFWLKSHFPLWPCLPLRMVCCQSPFSAGS